MKIKIICLNIWLGGLLFDEMVDFLQREDADVLLLQEVFDGKDQDLETRFKSIQSLQRRLNYPEYDFDRCFSQQFDFGIVERGNAILSKFPILERRSYYLGGEDGVFQDIPENFGKFRHNLQHVVLDAVGTRLNVYNFQGVWDLDGERDSPERLKMSERIMQAITGQENIVLAGDTNANPNTQTIRNVEARLTNIFKDELTTSFNLRRKDLEKFPGYATAVVDMAFVSPDIKVIDHSCPDVDISDHLPLIITLEL